MSNMHIMLDIETLGTAADSVVLSIGAVKFDPNDTPGDTIAAPFYRLLDIDKQVRAGRTITDATFRWWLRQEDVARQALSADVSASAAPDLVLKDLRAWMPKDIAGVWGNGSDFDNAMLIHMAHQFNVVNIWPFWKNRCFRTFVSIFDPKKKHRPVANDHHALHDASRQAAWMQTICDQEGAVVV